MRRFGLAAAVLGLVAVAAGVIIGASGITSPQSDLGGAITLANIINQSGLSAASTSGVSHRLRHAHGRGHA